MNSNDFYKSKYHKYKNKYLELKQKNLKINQEGGGLVEPGTYLFYIPLSIFKEFLRINQIVIKDKELIMEHDMSIGYGNVAYFHPDIEHLYASSILIIPIGKDDKILPTTEWFIPINTTQLKMTDNIQIDNTKDATKDNFEKFYNVAENFLIDKNIKKTLFIVKSWQERQFDPKKSIYCLKYTYNVSSSNKLHEYKLFLPQWKETQQTPQLRPHTNIDYEEFGEKLGTYIFYIPDKTRISADMNYKKLCELSLLVIPVCRSDFFKKKCGTYPNKIIPRQILNTDKWILKNNKTPCHLKIIENEEYNDPLILTYPELFCATKDCFDEKYENILVHWYKIKINSLKNELLENSKEPFSFYTCKQYYKNLTDQSLLNNRKIDLPKWFFNP